jgi:periplasmic protein CpxP/Spy
MTKRTAFYGVLVALVALAAASILYAQQGPMHHGGHGFGIFGHLRALRSQLNLTDDQVAQLKAIGKDLRTQNEPFKTQLHSGFQSIVKTLVANPNDLATAQSLLDQQTTAENAIKANVLAAASKALNVLTPDQRAKLADIIAQHEQKKHQ